VFFIDYGNISNVKVSELIVVDACLAELCDKHAKGDKTLCAPALAMACAIRGIAPNPIRSPQGLWQDDIIN